MYSIFNDPSITYHFYVSYFYQIRNMTPNCIPISTAIWDPKWFHSFYSQEYVFQDKNGVVNGLRAEPFAPISTACCDCINKTAPNCKFLKAYAAQLENLDFDDIIKRSKNLALKACACFSIDTNVINIIFMVHEAPQNKCSERVPLQKYFNEHGILLPEWYKEK